MGPEASLVNMFRTVHPRHVFATIAALDKRNQQVNNAGRAGIDDLGGALYNGVSNLLSLISSGAFLLWLASQPIFLQKVVVNAPFPLISSIVGTAFYFMRNSSGYNVLVMLCCFAILVMCVFLVLRVRVSVLQESREVLEKEHRVSRTPHFIRVQPHDGRAEGRGQSHRRHK